ncbi:SMP-30/gluconolactonase/LRE family protein [Prauserella cavernicola]|uniref:SMP-30/gluconolactonase/LRE family protein n=1 Tax=Prauserella cavernicola TaxID=2800127 RepID=A0A934V6B0_9PSEU|nr:SMP-30/gluconolactonase/LRE family protein [Prauserella cavernicola]MBK1786534.1 SMP-30/gluconolactonase/LRE family protein [Prauserella cavernicola]
MARFGKVELYPVNGRGPEDVLVDADGGVYTGLEDGRVIRVGPGGRRIDTIADTGGRPLGIEFFGDERELLVCDAHRGLLVVSVADGAVRTLVGEIDGVPMVFCNNAAVASDGTIYFTDTSTVFSIERYRDDLIEQTGTGRLFRRAPDGRVERVAGGLQFANGVALPPDESFVAVAETSACRVRRFWLKGEETGTEGIFVDDLPGFPDNISTGSDGLIWVSQASSKLPVLDVVRKLPAPVRTAVRALPAWLQPSPASTCGVLAVSALGDVVHRLEGEIDGFDVLSGVRERAGTLYFGSLERNCVATTPVPRA